MTHVKPLLTLSSLGLGAALVLVATHIQRDRFAFTSSEMRNLDAVTIVAPIPPSAVPEPVLGDEKAPVLRFEALKVMPDERSAPERKTPAAATKRIELVQPPCRPMWREVESGPAGRMVREICVPVSLDAVPRS